MRNFTFFIQNHFFLSNLFNNYFSSIENIFLLGRTLSARISVDVKTDPINLDIAMPSPGSYGGPTIVPHIIRFTEEGLEIAGPYFFIFWHFFFN